MLSMTASSSLPARPPRPSKPYSEVEAARLVGRPPPRARLPQREPSSAEQPEGPLILVVPSELSPPPLPQPEAHLELPPVRTQRLRSPPPSPPPEWVGGPEDGPNRLAFVDLAPTADQSGGWLLLPAQGSLPAIRLEAEQPPH